MGSAGQGKATTFRASHDAMSMDDSRANGLARVFLTKGGPAECWYLAGSGTNGSWSEMTS